MNRQSLLKLAEYSLLVGSGAGTMAAVTAQNVAYASAPLTLLVAVGLMNRNQLERQVKSTQSAVNRQHRQTTRKLNNLAKQVTAIPSPEAMNNFQRSVMDRSDRSFIRFSKALDNLRNQVNTKIEGLALPDLSRLYQDIDRLQNQYTRTCSEVEILSTYIQRLSTLPRVEAAETQLATLQTELMQTRVKLETLGSETKSAVSFLQDSMLHIERRLRQLPTSADSPLPQEEVLSFLKTIADAVPRREFNALQSRLNTLDQQQTDFAETLQTMAATASDARSAAVPGEALAAVEAQIKTATAALDRLQQQLRAAETDQAIHQQSQHHLNHHLSLLQKQLESISTFTQTLDQQYLQLSHHIETALSQPLPPSDEDFEALEQRLATTEALLTRLQPRSTGHGSGLPSATGTQWIVDFLPAEGTLTVPESTSQQALMTALATAQTRLLLVWPWADNVTLTDDLVAQFQRVLARNCQLEIGWCHRGNTQSGRLLQSINQRWGTEPDRLKALKTTLNQLLPLRQAYPNRFKFKVLGTDEGFLVCDRSFAILNVESLKTQNTLFPAIGLKLQTTDAAVITALTQRFDQPTLPEGDAKAFFNRGTTRYDLRNPAGAIEDFTQVVAIEPRHAIAFNDRGVTFAETGDLNRAEADFTQAIACDPNLFAAYCNRGWLYLEQKQYQAAAADFSAAIRIDSHSPIPYVYRGSALQHLGKVALALSDYTAAVECNGSLALPYFYRSAAYQKQGDPQQAIADLEIAKAQLVSQGDAETLHTVECTLNQLRQRAQMNGKANS